MNWPVSSPYVVQYARKALIGIEAEVSFLVSSVTRALRGTPRSTSRYLPGSPATGVNDAEEALTFIRKSGAGSPGSAWALAAPSNSPAATVAIVRSTAVREPDLREFFKRSSISESQPNAGTQSMRRLLRTRRDPRSLEALWTGQRPARRG